MTTDLMPGEVIKEVSGLPRDKLEYYVRAGYVHPKIITRDGRNYKQYSQKEVAILKQAYGYIKENKMQVREAFKKARDDYRKMPLLFGDKK